MSLLAFLPLDEQSMQESLPAEKNRLPCKNEQKVV
jgi:hypothetical protein